jgi:hypothetical protein
MGSLNEAALLQHDDAIGVHHGGEAMGDDERGASAQQGVDRHLHRLLGFGIERRSRLVEHEDWRVLQQRAGDRDALPFAD